MNDAPPPTTPVTRMGLVTRIGDRTGVRAWYLGRDLSPRVHLVLGLLLPLVVMAYNMWRVRDFTVDDAYISFRYAVNLAGGHGLVYNPGEAIEGYTNFLWTLLIAGGLGFGIDPHVSSKVMGALAGLATLVVVYRLSARVQPYGALPCLSTWLLASAPTTVCWAMFGLETSMFVFFIVLGLLLMFEEHDRGRGFPFSGLVFALAGLTRPEAPMFLGLAMLLLGRKMFGKQNLVRGVVFVIPLLVHMLWRHGYYGSWTPATLAAKTGDLKAQWKSGRGYVLAWLDHSGAINYLWFYGVGLAVSRRNRELGTYALLFFAVCAYVILVGGDWMSYYRHMAMGEPFVFLCACIGLRSLAQRRDVGALVAIALVLTWTWVDRNFELADARKKFVKEEKRFWDNTAGQVAEWLVTNGKPGRVALGDIGFVGYRTNYPILDLLGLVDPVISQLPGGYTKKNGPGYVERFYEVLPEWAVLIHSGQDCKKAGLKAVKTIVEDPRFHRRYTLMENFQVNADGSWCVFKRKDF